MSANEANQVSVYDVLIVGAGLSGICALHHIRERFPEWKVKLVDKASGVGGVWYWNSYPGARLDTESISYQISFDKEILDEWHWKETFSSQAELLRYLEFVCQKKNLYKDMQFDTDIKRATWQEGHHTWEFEDATGAVLKTRFFVSCVGFLSAPTLPAVPGIATFEGEAFHTSQWPKDFDISRDLSNKRVGVIGTGATGIQTITAVSKEPSIKSLSVFQRTANWSAPLRFAEISTEEMKNVRASYDEIFDRCARTPTCFLHEADPRKTLEVTEEERLELWNKLYDQPGFGKWLGVFSDTYTNREANKLYSDWMAHKIRERVVDPATADALIPKDHGFGARRVPLESGYFEAYNKSHVHLVDLKATPIETFTKHGIKTADGKTHELDVLIYATGFDAITGAFSAIEWHGKDDRPLIATSDVPGGERAIWYNYQLRTFLGLTIPSMPNMFTVLGPHQPFGNATRSVEHAVQVICNLLGSMKENKYSYCEPTEEAVAEWTTHVASCGRDALSNETDSWMTGVNTNVKGKHHRTVARYSGSAIEFRKRCEECRLSGWKGLVFK